MSDPLGQPGIRGHDVDFLGMMVGADQSDNLVISRIRCGFGRVVDCDRRRPNRRRMLEDDGYNMGVFRRPALELFDQQDSGAWAVFPPAIRSSPDDVHGVDDQPHVADGTEV
jgi:hypothetical protein